MNTSILKPACGLFALALVAGCADMAPPPAASGPKSGVLALPTLLCPTQTSPTVVCNVPVQITATPGQKNCTAAVTGQIQFNGTQPSTAKNIPIIWTLTPNTIGSTLSFKFDDSNGIQITADSNNQISSLKRGNGTSTNNWQYSGVNAQSVVGSSVTYVLNIKQVDSSSSVPVISPCAIGDPRIVND